MTTSRTSTADSILSWNGLFILLSIFCQAASAFQQQNGIPTFSIDELRSLARQQELQQTLGSTGLLAVQLDQIGYAWHRHTALQGLCECHHHPDFLGHDQTRALTLQDASTTRTSVATATVGLNHPLSLPEHLEQVCGSDVVESMEQLRDSLNDVSKAFVSALDDLVVANNGSKEYSAHPLLRDSHGKSYSTITDIVESASNLEHFHVYSKEKKNSVKDGSDSAAAAWDWHTDAGLFLVFVPAWNCVDNRAGDSSFWYKDAQGNPVKADFDGSNTAIIMLGQGTQDWLELKQQNSSANQLRLKPTVHSVRWDERSQPLQRQTSSIRQLQRAWYGMMYLVPETAMIYGAKTLRDVRSSLSWSKVSNNESEEEVLDESEILSIGCGISEPSSVSWNDEETVAVQVETMRRRLQHQDPSSCNNVTNFFCWMQCLPMPNANQAQGYVNEGYSLYCLDPAILASSGNRVSEAAEPCEDGFVHNANCLGSWQPTAPGVAAAEVDYTSDASQLEEPFCYSGTTMYMDGFHFVQSTTCIIFLFQSWVLDTGGKYALAFIGTILLGVCLEKLIQQRRRVMAVMGEGRKRLAVSAAFYAVQLTIGYFLMLVIMIYSGLMFIATVLGLACGHVFFNAKDAIWPLAEKSDKPFKVVEQNSDAGDAPGSELSTKDVEPCPGTCGCLDDEPVGETSCCGKKEPTVKTPLRKSQPIPEGGTPCCQFNSCD